MSLTLAHDAPCEFWRIKWNESHTRWRMKPHHHSMLNFIHVPKAAGHTVEEALTRAFTGASEGTSGTTDGHNFQAGHHTYTERLNHHGGKSQDFITVLREPLSRLVSRYNDVHNMLSEPSFCAVPGKAFWPKVKGGISIRTAAHSMQPSYCFTAYMGACKPGTGWNLVAMAEQNHNGSAPCVPALSFLEWLDCPARATTAGSSHWCAPIDEARHYIHPMAFDFPKSDPKLEEDLADELRKHYLLVGTLAKQGTVNHFLRRLAWLVDPPYKLVTPSSAGASTPTATTQTGYVPFSLKQLTEEERKRARAIVNEKHAWDVALYNAAVKVEEEQRVCYEDSE